MLGLKLLVGPRWQEFHCLVASRCCVSSLSHFALLIWCEALFVGEAFKQSEGVGKKLAQDPVDSRYHGLELANREGAGWIL